MEKPIFLNDDGDVLIFIEIDKMLEYIEPIDVEDGVYEAFDAKGYKIKLFVENRLIKLEKTNSCDEQRLKKILYDFLLAINCEMPSFGNVTLENLVEISKNYKRY